MSKMMSCLPYPMTLLRNKSQCRTSQSKNRKSRKPNRMRARPNRVLQRLYRLKMSQNKGADDRLILSSSTTNL